MAVETFRKFLEENSIQLEIIITDDNTHTAIDAAKVHNVPVSNIVKSLLVKVGNEFVMYLVPGDMRLDLERIKNEYQAESIRMATADEVKEITGYSIGGVPPFGHKVKLKTVIVDGFDINSMIVAAAGSSNSVFKCDLKTIYKLVSMSKSI